MLWFLVMVIVLVVAVVFNVGLLACAMLALLGLMVISRFLARTWITNLEATRDCNRTEAEVEAWKKKCPLIKFEKFVLEGGKIGKAELDRIANETQAELEAAVEFARHGTLPDPSEVTDDVFAK